MFVIDFLTSSFGMRCNPLFCTAAPHRNDKRACSICQHLVVGFCSFKILKIQYLTAHNVRLLRKDLFSICPGSDRNSFTHVPDSNPQKMAHFGQVGPFYPHILLFHARHNSHPDSRTRGK
eukprot:sb/3476220/